MTFAVMAAPCLPYAGKLPGSRFPGDRRSVNQDRYPAILSGLRSEIVRDQMMLTGSTGVIPRQ